MKERDEIQTKADLQLGRIYFSLYRVFWSLIQSCVSQCDRMKLYIYIYMLYLCTIYFFGLR